MSDPDSQDSLTTTFKIYRYDDNSVADTATVGGEKTVRLTVQRSVIQGWQSGGSQTPYRYYFTAQTKDNLGETGPVSETCYLFYNPLGPTAPTVTFPTTVTLGQSATAVFDAAAGCGAAGNPCPATYTYQLGAGKPVKVTANASGDWTGSVPIPVLGPFELTVTGIDATGNPGEPFTEQVTSTTAGTLADGYFSNGAYPDLLRIGTGSKPSLWLSQGTGNGALASPVDIGSLGTAVNPGADGPADWAGAEVLRGNFAGDNLQDVMAYYPAGTHAGLAQIIDGVGNAAPLAPYSGSYATVAAGSLAGLNNGDEPGPLVGAGNASGLGTGFADLIGISGDSTSPNDYELDLYTDGSCAGCGYPGGYTWAATLATTAPDGTADWNNYALAAAQPGSDPASPADTSTTLFALNKTTGALYQCTNPVPDLAADPPPALTWTLVTTPWGASPPQLVSADTNASGATELWTVSGTTATAYTVSSGALTKEGSGSSVAPPVHDWPLTDGSALLTAAGGSTTALDTITGTNASLTGGYGWDDDAYFGTELFLDGSTSYATPPAGTIPATNTAPSLSLWFKTTTAGGVLASLQSSVLTAGHTITSGYNPVLYIGTDGKLYGEWWNDTISPVISVSAVDDGLWHHAVLTGSGSTQTLYLDGQQQGTTAGTISLTGNPDLDYGSGYIGGGWPSEPHQGDGNVAYPDYFSGDIAAISLTH